MMMMKNTDPAQVLAVVFDFKKQEILKSMSFIWKSLGSSLTKRMFSGFISL